MIGQHLTLEQCTVSEYAQRKNIDNTPPSEIISVMNQTAINCYDKIFDHFGSILHINSFYRSPVVNKGIGGSKTSSHCKGEAIDLSILKPSAYTNQALFIWCLQNLDFDQILWEYGNDLNPAWVHVSYRKGNNRKQALRVKNINGKIVYTPYEAL